VLLGSVLLLPPTILMGGTLPLVTRFAVRALRDVGPGVARLYAVNTGGAVAGTIAGGFFFIETFGLDRSLVYPAFLNVALGLFALIVGLRTPPVPTGEEDLIAESERSAASARTEDAALVYPSNMRRRALIGIALGGALTMLYELVWIRVTGVVLGSSVHSFALMLTAFIAGIAIGGEWAARLLLCGRDAYRLFALAEGGVFVWTLALMPLYDMLPLLFHEAANVVAPSEANYVFYHLAKLGTLWLLLLVPATLIGMTLPLASRVGVASMSVLGKKVGSVFSVNCIGTFFGAALTGLVLIPNLGLERTLILGVTCTGLLSAWLLAADRSAPARVRRLLVVVPLLAGVGAIAGSPWWRPELLHMGVFRREQKHSFTSIADYLEGGGAEPIFAKDDDNCSVAVLRYGKNLSLKVNGKADASTRGDMETQTLCAHLPLMLHRGEPKDVFIIGLGSGVTAAAALRHAVKVETAEISRAVVEAAHLFGPWNDDCLDNPRHRVHVIDAREYLGLAADKTFDVIISEPSNPWIAGIASLFTREYLASMKAHLNPGGMYLQWMQGYAIKREHLALVARTMQSVYQNVTLWQSGGVDYFLLASDDAIDVDPVRLRERLEATGGWRGYEGLDMAVRLRQPEVFLTGQILTPDAFRTFFPPEEPLLHDLFPRLEYVAPRSAFAAKGAVDMGPFDERQHHRFAEKLLLERYLGSETLHEDRLFDLEVAYSKANLWDFIEARMSIALHRFRVATPEQQAHIFPSLSQPVRVAELTRERAAKYALQLGTASPSANLCEQLADALEELEGKTSVLYFPYDPAEAEPFAALCEGADHREATRFRWIAARRKLAQGQACAAELEAIGADEKGLKRPERSRALTEAAFARLREGDAAGLLANLGRALIVDPDNELASMALGGATQWVR